MKPSERIETESWSEAPVGTVDKDPWKIRAIRKILDEQAETITALSTRLTELERDNARLWKWVREHNHTWRN